MHGSVGQQVHVTHFQLCFAKQTYRFISIGKDMVMMIEHQDHNVKTAGVANWSSPSYNTITTV